MDRQISTRWTLQYWCNDQGVSVIDQWLDSLTREQLKSKDIQIARHRLNELMSDQEEIIYEN